MFEIFGALVLIFASSVSAPDTATIYSGDDQTAVTDTRNAPPPPAPPVSEEETTFSLEP